MTLAYARVPVPLLRGLRYLRNLVNNRSLQASCPLSWKGFAVRITAQL
jgi:hypothetical protein